MIKGSIVAIVTPMHEDGSLDFHSLGQLIDWHIASGTDGIVVVGTTGESATVNVDEHCSLIEFSVKHAQKRIPIIAGSGANCTQEAIRLTGFAREVGADACLQVVPYYNKPSQEGMFRHFATIAESVDIPIILYNVPGRTGTDISNETIVRLTKFPSIIGVKEASGNIARGIDLLRMVPKSFSVYSGDDATALALMLCGGRGNISVTANIAPREMHQLCLAAMSGKIDEAIVINNRLLPLHQKLFVEANPIPTKWALQAMGKISTGIRLPLTSLAEEYHETVLDALKDAGVFCNDIALPRELGEVNNLPL